MIKHILPRYAGIDRATCEKLQRTGRPVVAMRLIVREEPLPAAGGTVRLPLEEDGFEPSALCPGSSIPAAFTASVAANLHPYSAPICTPASTETVVVGPVGLQPTSANRTLWILRL
jgi:hypothetical protein